MATEALGWWGVPLAIIAGTLRGSAPFLFVNGKNYTATRAEMYQNGVFTLPEEPLRNACVPHMSVAENLALRTFDRPPQAKGWLLVFKAIRAAATNLINSFAIKTPSLDTPVNNLSGGNVQRTVLARELSTRINLLIAANPCFGLDFAAVEYIHTQIIAARNRGVAVLLVSEDLDELLTLGDRIVVISEGKFVYESAMPSLREACLRHAPRTPTAVREATIATADITTIGQRMAGH